MTPPGWCTASTRDLDRRYLDRPPASSHRPYFALVGDLAADLLAVPGATVLDLGCANGSFVHHVLARYPHVRATGVDALPELVADAAREVAGATFVVGDVRLPSSLPVGPFSLVTMLTLLSHFDEVDAVLDTVMSRVAPGGRALLFGAFNPEPADVLVRIRTDGAWLPGWNVHSRATTAALLGARGFRTRFHDYAGAWPGRPGDPLGTRPAELDGRPAFVNGACLVLPFAVLEAW